MGRPFHQVLEAGLREYAAWYCKFHGRPPSFEDLARWATEFSLADTGRVREYFDPPQSSGYTKACVGAHGPIPPGHEVHHRDYNHHNDDPDNLVAMSFEEHRTLHGGLASLKGAARRKSSRQPT